MGDGSDDVTGRVREEADEYRAGAPRPLSGYVLVMAVFAAVLVAAAGAVAATGRRLPADVRLYDLVLMSVCTHKLSRLVSKDAVTSPLRSPFTRFAESGEPAEVSEEVRHTSQLRHAAGELLTCPFCMDLWIATGCAIGMVFAPRFTRLVAATMSAMAGADFLQILYSRLQGAR